MRSRIPVFQYGVIDVGLSIKPRLTFEIPFIVGFMIVFTINHVFFGVGDVNVTPVIIIFLFFYFIDIRRTENEILKVEREIDDGFWEQ